jgi:hypothetical protein
MQGGLTTGVGVCVGGLTCHVHTARHQVTNIKHSESCGVCPLLSCPQGKLNLGAQVFNAGLPAQMQGAC